MAFVLRNQSLNSLRRLAVEVDPSARILRASELGEYRRAGEIVTAACAQADAIVSDAKDTLERERRRGYAEGLERAQRELARHMAEQVARAHEYFVQIEDSLVDVVLQATRRIVEGYAEHEQVAYSVRNSLRLKRHQKQITVRVHPRHVEYVRARADELLAGYPGIDVLDVVSDARLESGKCVLESEIGTVEASVESQLDAVEAALRKTITATRTTSEPAECETTQP